MQKPYKLTNMFLNIQRTRSQIMNHMIYAYPKKSHECFTNDKLQSSYIE
jgi:hypothetical protein